MRKREMAMQKEDAPQTKSCKFGARAQPCFAAKSNRPASKANTGARDRGVPGENGSFWGKEYSTSTTLGGL